MAWHVYTRRTESGTYVQHAIPPLADRPPARNAEYSADGCWADEHDAQGVLVAVYVWLDGELAKPQHVAATKARKASIKQLPRKGSDA